MGDRPKRILVAPLNWGLGHATRCIPLIKSLQQNQCEVILAANGAAAKLLQSEFPTLTLLTPPATEISYSRSATFFVWHLIIQLPRMIKQVQQEKKWLAKQIDMLQIEAVISDNRYGLFHPSIPSILITHQLEVKTGLGKWINKIVTQLMRRLLLHFDELWIPDYTGAFSLAGELSHPKTASLPPVKYLGLLNRFSELTNSTSQQNGSVLLMVSGPEPQRSLLEKIFREQLIACPGVFTLICGKPKITQAKKIEGKESLPLLYGTSTNAIHEHLDAHQLQEEIKKAEFIICRSGYTSLMELIPTWKKILLIPTPGQAEQTYLAKYCQEKGYAPYLTQKEFTLEKALQVIQQFSYTPYRPPAVELSQWIKNWLNHTR